MSKDFGDIQYEAALALMREAGWDPQTHDRSEWDPVNEGVARIMNHLAQGDMAKAASSLTDFSGEMAGYLDKRYRLISSERLNPPNIRATLCRTLGQYYRVPTLSAVS